MKRILYLTLLWLLLLFWIFAAFNLFVGHTVVAHYFPKEDHSTDFAAFAVVGALIFFTVREMASLRLFRALTAKKNEKA